MYILYKIVRSPKRRATLALGTSNKEVIILRN